MDRVTRAKIDSLLYELRSMKSGETCASAEELARRFHLDPMIVRSVAQGEGLELGDQVGEPEDSDPNQSTLVMNLDEIVDEDRGA